MGEKVQFLTIFAGLVLYVGDLIFDCYVCLQYYLNGEFWWFSITLSFIVLPSVLVSYSAVIQLRVLDKSDTCNKMKYIAIYFTNCGVIVRYFQELAQCFNIIRCERSDRTSIMEKKSLESAYLMAWLRYLETITESAPQWCLQTYIMLRQWYFPWHTVVSVVLSLLSLAWSVTTLEKARELREDRNFNLITTVSFLIWQLSSLISRLSAIVILAYVHRYYVFIFFVINWLLNLLLVVVILVAVGTVGNVYSDCHNTPNRPLLFFHFFCYVITISYSVMFHFTHTQLIVVLPCLVNYKRYVALGNVFLALGNIIMLTLSVTIENPYAPYMGMLKPAAISLVVGPLLISFVFYLAYYKRCSPERKYDDQPNHHVNEGFEAVSM